MRKKIGVAALLIVMVSGVFLYLGLKKDTSDAQEEEIVLRYMGWVTKQLQ